MKSNQLNPEFFNITEDQEKELRLITPSRNTACANTVWNNENKWYRSRVETLDGKTVSQGFSKFLNLGQDNEDIGVSAPDILDALQNNQEIIATLKQDGSCLIRSVFNGEVILRTRGSMRYTYHPGAEDEMTTFTARYPKLLDPTWQMDKSLLMEWVTPDFQIVIKYKQPELYLLGAVLHNNSQNDMRYLTMQEMELISEESGIELTEYFKINTIDGWHHFYNAVIEDKEIEGFVMRLGDQQNLVKIKANAYIIKHSVKSNLSFKNMIKYWLDHKKDGTQHELLRQLEEDYDEEVVMWALPFVDNLFIAVKKWESSISDITGIVNKRRHWLRKDFAIKTREEYKDDPQKFSIAMQLWQNKPIDDRLIQNFMIQFDQGLKGQFN